jgi:hypothetical protein
MIIDVPGVGKIEFPDGTSREEANRAIAEFLGSRQQPEPRGVAAEIGRQVGLTGVSDQPDHRQADSDAISGSTAVDDQGWTA